MGLFDETAKFTAGQDLSYWNGSSVVALAGTEVRGTPTIPSALNNGNVFEELMTSVKYCSLGEITHTLFQVGGKYRRSM